MSTSTLINGTLYLESIHTGTESGYFALVPTIVNGNPTNSTSYITSARTILIPVTKSPAETSSAGTSPSTLGIESATLPTTSTTSTAGGTTLITSSTSTSTSPTHTKPAKHSSGLPGGKVAGVAIACVVAGALFAGLLIWFFMSSRHKKHRSSRGGFAAERHRSHGNSEKALPGVLVTAVGVTGNWEKHLDQPESDNTITRSVKGLFDHIEVHVENFYRDANVNVTPELQAQLMRVDSHHLPDSVAGLLPQTQSPTMLIKHCIAHSIVEHISSESDIQDSFLPADFVALPQVLAALRTTIEKPAYNQAYSRWRVLSSYLRPKPAEDATYTSQRDARIAASADLLCRTFEPWAMTRDNFQSRRENLINIMKSAAETGILLFSQPSSFKWGWSIPEIKSGRLRVVLLPGLEKVRDESANEIRPLELLRPTTGVVIG